MMQKMGDQRLKSDWVAEDGEYIKEYDVLTFVIS